MKTKPRSRLAQPCGVLDQRVEHRLELEGGAADRLQHLGGGGLLLQRFLRLVEQPRVLDRDHRLIGEGAQQAELLVVEAHVRLARDGDHAHALPLPHHRRHQDGEVARLLPRQAKAGRHVRTVHDVGQVHLSSLADDHGTGGLFERPGVACRGIRARRPMHRRQMQLAVTRSEKDRRAPAVEQAFGAGQYALEHRLGIGH